ncbi:TFIIB zinc-binding [Carpediemonas membranifera]|uniref:General transcription factor TFIIB n=1 Tax=Carpediemonas membranifera TaxID=201153 RepID=A0A8J6E1L8_9EUKA|nr:TFIIB zinc-binding [Carpediemonas membranifera]|eukprot:KAG9393221.1 TFIIB zinc-binding [Carpediemonas membranifera]
MQEQQVECHECGSTNTEERPHAGDIICKECGIVVGQYIDKTSEWRSFADDSSSQDRSRVGGKENEFGSLHLSSGRGFGSGTTETRIEKSTKELRGEVERLMRRFNFQPAKEISTRAVNIYTSYLKRSAKSRRGRSIQMFAAACIRLALDERGGSVSLKDLSRALQAEFGKSADSTEYTPKKIEKVIREVSSEVAIIPGKTRVANADVNSMLDRIGAVDGMTYPMQKLWRTRANAVAEKGRGLAYRSETVAAAAIIVALADKELAVSDSAEAEVRPKVIGLSGVTEATVLKAQAELEALA